MEQQLRYITSLSFVLPYAAEIQRKHIKDICHLQTTHKCTLAGLKIVRISDCKFLSTIKNPLIRWLRGSKEVVTVIEEYNKNLYTVNINNGRFLIVFEILPLTTKSHFLRLSIFSNMKLPRIILRPIMKLAITLTLFEDLSYYEKEI